MAGETANRDTIRTSMNKAQKALAGGILHPQSCVLSSLSVASFLFSEVEIQFMIFDRGNKHKLYVVYHLTLLKTIQPERLEVVTKLRNGSLTVPKWILMERLCSHPDCFLFLFRILTLLNPAWVAICISPMFTFLAAIGLHLRMLGGLCKHFRATNTSYFQRAHEMLEYQVSNYKPANGALGLDDFQRSLPSPTVL